MNGSDSIDTTTLAAVVAEAVDTSYFTFIDYCVFIVILSFSLVIGIYFGFFSDNLKTAEDYLVGAHQMKVVPIAISLVASQLSAIAIIAIPAEVYSFGWYYLLIVPALVVVTWATNILFLPVFYHNNIDNCYAYLELRFSKSVRSLVTVIFIMINLFFLPVIMYIPCLAFVEVTKHNINVVNCIVSIVCIIYTMLGGIKAVVWTDVLQALVMVGSVVIVAVSGVIHVGGVEEVWNRGVAGGRIMPYDFSLSLTNRVTFWNTIAQILIGWMVHVTFSQNCVQRLVSLPSLRKAKQSMLIFFVGVVFLMSLNASIGLIMYAFYHDCDPVRAQIVTKSDKLMPRFVRDVTGNITGMSGVFISCVFSASLSTLSAAVHSISGVIYNDYIRPRKWFAHTDANANLTMRLTICIIGAYCAIGGVIVEHFGSLFQVIGIVAGISTGAIFGVFTLGMLYPFANKKGALYSFIISMITVLIVIVNTQYYTAQGKLHYDIIPTSIEGCSNDTIARMKPTPPIHRDDTDEGFAFYKISFQWYPFIGLISFYISAIIISYCTGGQDFSNFNIQLLSPCVQNLVPRKYRHVELKPVKHVELVVNKNDDEKKSKLETEWILTNDEDKATNQ